MCKIDLIDFLKVEDLSEDMIILEEIIGFENVKKIIKAVGGTYFTVPKLHSHIKTKTRALDELIKKGYSIRRASQELGFSYCSSYKYLHQDKKI